MKLQTQNCNRLELNGYALHVRFGFTGRKDFLCQLLRRLPIELKEKINNIQKFNTVSIFWKWTNYYEQNWTNKLNVEALCVSFSSVLKVYLLLVLFVVPPCYLVARNNVLILKSMRSFFKHFHSHKSDKHSINFDKKSQNTK